MDAFDLNLWPEFSKTSRSHEGNAFIDQVCIDSRRISSDCSLFVALEGRSDGHDYVGHAAQQGAKFAIVHKNWKPLKQLTGITLLRVDDPLCALQSLAAAYRLQLNCKLIAIIGTHGKTMVKDLLQLLLSDSEMTASSPESFNSQIGAALSLFRFQKHHKIALIEAAISKPHEMSALAAMIQPEAIILTHIEKKHLATLGSLEACASEMSDMLKIPKRESWVLLPKTTLLQQHYAEISASIHSWNEHSAHLPYAYALSSKLDREIPYRITFPDGNHYRGIMSSGYPYFLDLINIAIKAAWLLNVPSETIHHHLDAFFPEPMRTEIWRSPTGITFINDSYSSDPQSIDQALKFYHLAPSTNRNIFLFSGMRNPQPNHTDYGRVGIAIAEADIHFLFLIGKHPFAPLIDEIRKKKKNGIEIIQVDDYTTALSELQKHIKTGDVVLIKGEKKIALDILVKHFNDSLCSNQCIINLSAIKNNLAYIKNHASTDNELMVMVKAFAYGTDEVQTAKFLETCGIKFLGVSYADEGVNLKRAGIPQDIFVLNAAPYEAEKVVKWGLTVGISDIQFAEILASAAASQKKILKVHLHINTGMGRFGCRPEEAVALAIQIDRQPWLRLEGIMTHFASADDPTQDSFTVSQIKLFDAVIADLHTYGIDPKWKHAANSSAAVRFDLPQYNMMRIGLAAYGFYTSEAVHQKLELTRALSLVSRIVYINNCKAGESISYGRSYVVQQESSRIAVLPIGYFDGLHRHYSNKGNVLIRGKKAPMVGKICMDFMMVDISNIPEADVGDQALIFGYDQFGHYLSPEDLADDGNSIVHELITCLGPRLQRVFILEESKE